jgi:hypothetical protein
MASSGLRFTDDYVTVIEAPLFFEPMKKLVYWQFAMELDDLSKKSGETVRVIGPQLLARPTDPRTSRRIAAVSSRLIDNPVQELSNVYQEVTIDEWALLEPLIVREYNNARTMHDQAHWNGVALARDFHETRDELIQEAMLGSGFVRYVSGVAAETDMTTSLKFSTDEFVANAAILSLRDIPTFADGKYISLIDAAIEATLMVEEKYQAAARAMGDRAPLFTGHVADFGNIHFVLAPTTPTVEVNSDGTPFDASQALMFGTSTYDMFPVGTADGLIKQDRLDWLGGMGAGPVVVVRAQPVEVRLGDETDYGRQQTMTWLEHGQYSVLDPGVNAYDGTKTVGTDTRYIQKVIGATVLS